MRVMISRDSALMSLRRKRGVVPVTVMVAGGIDTLVGTGVASAAEADRESIDGGELLVLYSLATSYDVHLGGKT
jgi:hypothetical protein